MTEILHSADYYKRQYCRYQSVLARELKQSVIVTDTNGQSIGLARENGSFISWVLMDAPVWRLLARTIGERPRTVEQRRSLLATLASLRARGL